MYWSMIPPASQIIGSVIFRVVVAVIVAVTIGGSYYYTYNRGFSRAELAGQVKLSEYKEMVALEVRVAEARVREVERVMNKKLQEQQAEKEREIESINARHRALVSSLRERASRPATVPTPKADPTPAPAPQCAGEGSTGQRLYREDAEFLAGEAAKGDILRQALRAARAAYQALVDKLQ